MYTDSILHERLHLRQGYTVIITKVMRSHGLPLSLLVVLSCAPKSAPKGSTAPQDEDDTPGEGDTSVLPLSFSSSDAVGTGTDRTARMVSHDLNGDGWLDLILANGRHDPEANVFILREGEGWGAPQELDGPARSYAVRPSDLNGDGHTDLVVASTAPDACVAYFDDGTLTFGQAVPLNDGRDNIRNLVLADLNGDGHQDMVVAHRSGPNRVGLNDGSGDFSYIGFGSGADASVGLSIADFNADGHLDIGVANRSPDATAIYLGDGSGDFSAAEPVTVGDGADDVRWMAAGDFNGDGFIDLATIQYRGQDRIYLQDKPMQFTPSVHLGSSTSASYTVTTVDMDGNGLLDILVGRKAEWNVLYLQGPGLDFSVEVPFGTGSDVSYSVETADMDNDGDLDILVGNSQQQNWIYYQD